jgi:hypothetical protein
MNELLSNVPPTRTTPARTDRTQQNLSSLVNINMEDLGALANMDQQRYIFNLK